MRDLSDSLEFCSNSEISAWSAIRGLADASILELNITKDYYNSHRNTGHKQLPRVVMNGNINNLKRMLAEGADVNSVADSAMRKGSIYASGFTLLHAAIGAQQFDMVLFLLENGADVNRTFKIISGDIVLEERSVSENLDMKFPEEDLNLQIREAVERSKIVSELATEVGLFSAGLRSAHALIVERAQNDTSVAAVLHG